MKKIIGYTVDRETGIYNSLGQHQAQSPYLDFLLADSDWNTIKVFANLDADVAGLLGLIKLTPKELEKLLNEKKVIASSGEKIYTIKYIPGKWFSIDRGFSKGHPYAGFSDINQYKEITKKNFPDTFTVSKAVQLRHKSTLAGNIGAEVYQAFTALGFHPNSLISPANVYRKEVLDKLDLPVWDKNIPDEAMELAYECCNGNWVEAFAIGHWDKVYDYDINSAYPYQASKLLDLRQGTWKQSKEYEYNASYGYCRCEVMIDSDFSPIIWNKEERNYTPTGVFEKVLTKAQIDFINKWNLGYVTIIDGWWWFSNGVNILPLQAEVKWLYKEKQEAVGVKREIVKRIMAGSFYGLFLETRGKDFGKNFMAPWATEIETRTQLEIARFCLINKVTPLHVAVDGVITSQPIPILESSEEIGNWRLEHEGKALICSSGLVAMETKNGKGDFSVSYRWLMNQIKQNPEAEYYTMKKEAALTLAQAANLGRIADVGKVETVEKTVEYGDNKRLYEKMSENFGKLAKGQYQSEAWPADMLKLLEETPA